MSTAILPSNDRTKSSEKKDKKSHRNEKKAKKSHKREKNNDHNEQKDKKEHKEQKEHKVQKEKSVPPTPEKVDAPKRKRTESTTDEIPPAKKAKIEPTPLVGGQTILIKETDESPPVSSFAVSPETVSVLSANGVETLFPIQARAYDYVMAGFDILGRARTGTGKTLSFSLPVVELLLKEVRGQTGRPKAGRGPRAIILAPTRELCIQVEKVVSMLCRNELTSICVYGGTTYNVQVGALRRGVDIVVGTTGRVMDFMKSGSLSLTRAKYFVCDEADRMLDMGFLPDVKHIMSSIPKENNIQTLLYSATIPASIKSIIKEHLKPDYITIDLAGGKDTQQTSLGVKHYVMLTAQTAAYEMLETICSTYAPGGKVIIFCNTKASVTELSISSSISNNCEALHGDIVQKQREQTLEGFRSGKFGILVATDVAARGLDIEGVDLVIQMYPRMPADLDAYVHRSGRTGRAGKKGVCISFIHSPKVATFIQTTLKVPVQYIGPPQPAQLYKMSSEKAITDILSVDSSIVTEFLEYASDLVDRYIPKRAETEKEEPKPHKDEDFEEEVSSGKEESEESSSSASSTSETSNGKVNGKGSKDKSDSEEDAKQHAIESLDLALLAEKEQKTLEILARALAVITGNTQEKRRWSLLGAPGKCTIKMKPVHPRTQIRSAGYIISVLKDQEGLTKIGDIQIDPNGNGCIVDVLCAEAIDLCRSSGRNQFTYEILHTLPEEYAQPQSREKPQRNGGDRSFGRSSSGGRWGGGGHRRQSGGGFGGRQGGGRSGRDRRQSGGAGGRGGGGRGGRGGNKL